MSNSGNVPTSSTYLEAQDDPGFQTEIIKNLRNEAQRRGFWESPGIAGIEFSIEWPDELTKILAPRFFISDLVCWRPLQGEDDLLESGIVIGMKYWAPGLPEIPVLPEGLEPEWQYLIYLDKSSPSRAWVKTDWASESDLLLQYPMHSSTVCVEWEE